MRRLPLSPDSPVSPVLWFAVLGAPLAGVLQFAIGYWIAQAQCSPTGGQWGIAVKSWALGVGALGETVAIAAGLTALLLWRRTAGADVKGPPPAGRIRFLAAVGMTVAPLFIFLIAMTSIGAAVLYPCTQS